ncbi:hypothetical protein ZIOFF_006512 [Zingiber officinale]|uniref:GTD-binding domain-containing protein n=1 Tax=Zingiber officinale TaxID=94328 RepID=A0A8J5LVQ6_ZINOF|nr:hypothetical protein ZIOFF_006512 [Zingiber officinale]
MVAGTAAPGQQAAPAATTEPDRLVSSLLAAVSELCLIAILLVDAVLSYAATRFARACRLQPPCLFCSRLDHALGGERRGFYRHILCHSHKIEVSSLIYCHAHGRLASCRSMCEACLLSSSDLRKPKLPVFHAAETEHLGDVALLYGGGGGDLGQVSVSSCSCCAEPFTLRRDVEEETSAEQLGLQQVDQDQMTMAELYKELEEERSASAVAAYEAMAMINRLQEEKAGMQMEALHYRRMMEEQAEHDQEAIHELNNLLTDREKELIDLEAELESCRKRLGEETTEPEEKSSHETELKRMAEGFEEDKARILACLKNLQEKIDNGVCCGSLQDEVSKLKDRLHAHYAEKEILSRAVGALRHGADGVSLVEEMACQLRELRRIPVT